ncbi:hypothetical protein [Klebsiella pneumoniae]|uniref:hypothetical protein n=1 Tax=Klebsiella pneumoniae TaxID=573 RepID=UPI00226F89AD|nr:hypothetical protein [Klebsiella pneumoniae]MCY0155224.1 hypothetical protein [Klebsiella pneumoniae]
MHEHHKSSLLLVENQHWGLGMRRNMITFFNMICFTLYFHLDDKDSLCELILNRGVYMKLAAFLACNFKRNERVSREVSSTPFLRRCSISYCTQFIFSQKLLDFITRVDYIFLKTNKKSPPMAGFSFCAFKQVTGSPGYVTQLPGPSAPLSNR